jgi:hypothetical protein
MIQYKSISVEPSNPKVTFKCKYSFSGIRVCQINIPFLGKVPQHLWITYLESASVKFTSTSTDGSFETSSILLTVSPNQIHPSFEFNFFVPTTNEQNSSSLSPFFNRLEIELIAPKMTKEFKIWIVYAEIPEVIKI